MPLCIKVLAYSIPEFVKESTKDFPGGPVVKNLPANTGGTGSIPGLR